jgi:group I intron endonuclease
MRHQKKLQQKKHFNRYLQRAWNKYGEDSFVFEVLLICHPSECVKNEQLLIDSLNSVKNGYNIIPTAGSWYGMKHTEEARKKISESKKNISEETRARIGAASKGRICSEETRAKISATGKGRNFSAETRRPETRAKNAAAQRGKKYSMETRNKISEARKRRSKTPLKKQKSLFD